MSPHLPFAMENPNSTVGVVTENIPKMSGATSVGGILLDEDRSGNSPSLPSLSGLPLRIRAATLPALIELCIICFDDNGSVLEAATNYPNIFFLMHKWFTTSESLAHHFRTLYEQGKPSYNDYMSLLATLHNVPSQATGDTSSSRPPSVILSRRQQDDCNGNIGSRSPLIKTANGRSNSVLIPRPACVGAEDDNYYNYQYNKVHTSTNGEAKTNHEKGQTDKSDNCTVDCKHEKETLCCVYKFRRLICYAVRFWILQFPVHFDLDPKLSAFIKDWQKSLVEDNYPELSSLVDLSYLPSYDWIRNISVRDPSVKHCRKVSLVFNHLEPSELAEHLTYLEHRIMRRISFQDYKQYAVTGSLTDNPRLERSVNLFNGLTQWVQCMVLSRSTPQQRAEVIVKLIDVTKKLRDLRNFNSLMAVVGGLSHSSLARLARTAARVPPDCQRALADLSEFLSSSSNFSNYRRALQECKGFKIPILGVHMKDLISLHVALSDTVDGGYINFRKMAQLSLIFQELQELQNATPPPGANVDLVNTLRVSLELAYTEDEIYELSLAREPRDSFSPQSSPTRPSILGDWPASGHPIQNITTNNPTGLIAHDVAIRSASLPLPQGSLLPTRIHADLHPVRFNSVSSEQEDSSSYPERKKTLEERMNDMVDAVFGPPKNEFLKLIQRSPCNNASVDGEDVPESHADDGHTFRKHDFQETSSFRPCTCAHCNGLLWGPLRQGYKCKECGIAAHKMCKDAIISRCRPKSLGTSNFSEIFQSGSGRTRFRRRKKLSSQSDVDSLESGLLVMECCCELTCPSPCRPLVQQGPSCDQTDFQDHLSDKSPLSSTLSPGSSNDTSASLSSRCQIFRSPKRRSLITTGSLASPFTTSPLPIRQRKTSLSFTSPCRSFPGTDPSTEGQQLPLRSSLSTSPRRKISDTLQLLTSSKSSCSCPGHH